MGKSEIRRHSPQNKIADRTRWQTTSSLSEMFHNLITLLHASRLKPIGVTTQAGRSTSTLVERQIQRTDYHAFSKYEYLAHTLGLHLQLIAREFEVQSVK